MPDRSFDRVEITCRVDDIEAVLEALDHWPAGCLPPESFAWQRRADGTGGRMLAYRAGMGAEVSSIWQAPAPYEVEALAHALDCRGGEPPLRDRPLDAHEFVPADPDLLQALKDAARMERKRLEVKP